MAIERIELGPETDLRSVVERVSADKLPRLIERDGEPLAMLVSPDTFAPTEPKSRVRKSQLLSFAGGWSDLDAERMIAEIYRRREESPPSPPMTP